MRMNKINLLVIGLLIVTNLFAVRVGNKNVANAIRINVTPSDNSIYITGFTKASGKSSILTASYLPSNGSLNPGFGAGGIVVVTDFVGDSVANDLTINTNDEKILIGGYVVDTDSRTKFVILQYDTSGVLEDNSPLTLVGDSSVINALTFQPSNNRIIAAGTAIVSGKPVIIIALYGSLDVSPLITVTEAGNRAEARGVTLQSDGKIVVAGLVANPRETIALTRYDSDGDLDPSFGASGIAIIPTARRSYATDVRIQDDGKIVISGAFGKQFLLARFNTNGSLDLSFGDGGFAIGLPGLEGRFNSLIIQSDNKIVAAGFATTNESIFARFNTDGSLDPSFGDGGVVVIPGPRTAVANDVTLQSDSKALGAGFICNDAALYRMLVNGTLDPSFGGDGIVRNPTGAPCPV